MKLYFMKQAALDYLKANLKVLYTKYYREKSNQWVYDLFDYDPFELFLEVPDFTLSPITNKKGEVDLQNCKIIYSKLAQISESQASDERLWAGLCHSTFYEYVRERYDYDNMMLKDESKDESTIRSRFFFSGTFRTGFFRNALAKCWWVGKLTYQPKEANKFQLLDALGPDDFSSKVNELFYSNTFSSNPSIVIGICQAWKLFSDNGVKLTVREYMRPALQYLNALGGGILLDALTSEEIKDIFFEYVNKLRTGEVSLGESDEEYNDDLSETPEANISESIQEMRKANIEEISKVDTAPQETIVTVGKRSGDDKDIDKKRIILGKPEKVDLGCKVIVVINGTKRICYNIPEDKAHATRRNEWYQIYSTMLGKSVGFTFKMYSAGKMSEYIIESIDW